MSGKHFLSMYPSQVEGNFIGGPKQQQGGKNIGNLNQDEMHRKIDRSKVYKFENKASGIILIKQDYKKLFYNPSKKLSVPLKEVEILFYTRQSSEDDVLKIILANRKIQIQYQRAQVEGDKIVDRVVAETYQTNEIFFPSPEEAPLMLQKKIWVELNRLNRSLEIFSGDVVNYKNQKPLARVVFKNPHNKKHEGWSSEVDKFEVPTYSKEAKRYPLKVIDHFTEIQFFYVNFRLDQERVAQEGHKISDFVTLQVLNLARIFDPVIEENVSLLKPSLANLESMPGPLRNLYECLKNLDIRQLPDFTDTTFGHNERSEYLSWRELQFAIQHSLVTPYGYSFSDTPLGIMNHLYKLKCGKEYKEFKPFATDKNNKRVFQSKDQMLDDIYANRAGYIRLELLPHEGLGPGSMAVMEIWPPYHCSSIHNHGDAYGLIKVLSGSIRVQNFSQLAFSALEDRPYLENDYLQDQYTWLSELSFGIHRLVNVKPQTCLTLQSYYHNEVTQQYFSVVKRINGVHTYIEYYPQNDWVNYLSERDNPKVDAKDRELINRIISRYGLMVNGRLDTSFQRLVLTLKKEYEYYHRTLATEYFQ